MESLETSFIKYCDQNNFEKNFNQIKIIKILSKHFYIKKNFFDNFFNSNKKLGFYLHGNVGVGKTMLLNFFYNYIEIRKKRTHFNEFMISFHDYRHKYKNKNNSINQFVKNLKKKYELIFFDEFQITNIVDAMILGKLFKKIFEEKIKVIYSSNTNINDLYKDGLQREQFIPFIKILEKNCIEEELLIDEDYRLTQNEDLDRFLSPINESTNFKFNKFFRKITKDKNKTLKVLEVKGRKIILENFYNGVVKFDFEELCNRNLGSEDYIKVSESCNFIFIEKLPHFEEDNSNQQQRFITLIDIIYEKKIPLMITSYVDLNSIKSSKSMTKPFKRTISRLYELTSINYN